jgi:5-methylcytosine-specific restriction endonuclease McrA
MNFRQGWKAYLGKLCPYCCLPMGGAGDLQVTADHHFPRARGGSDKRYNRVFCCSRCNRDKADMTLSEFHEWLVSRGDVRVRHVVKTINKIGDGRAYYRTRSLEQYRKIAGYLASRRKK